MILTCTCTHKEQDELHGKGKRVCNQMKNPKEARCTVCKAIRDTGVSKKETK